MLKHISIQNYALIESLEIDFNEKFSIITGETGAGKSIILGALSLILGNRADHSALYNIENKCVIEGVFNIKGFQLENFFSENDIDYDLHCIIRREITPSGRSRAFINDTPVQLSLLKELGITLIDIHSQNSLLEINQGSFQMAVVDEFADNIEKLQHYREVFFAFKNMQQKLQQTLEKEEEIKKEEDYLSFLFNEFEEANLQEKDVEAMEEELKLLNNSEEIKQGFFAIEQMIQQSEENIINSLNQAQEQINNIAKFDKRIENLSERLQSNIIDIKDIADEITALNESAIYDQERIDILTKELNSVYHLQQKHHVQSVAELLEIKSDIDKKLQQINSLDTDIESMKKEKEKYLEEATKRSRDISERRLAVIPNIKEFIDEKLHVLGMPKAEFDIKHTENEVLQENGKDKLQFVFTANKGQELQPIHKVASGGELSRLMLSIKAVVADTMKMPTMIFDEIDSGVSGDIASKVGKLMKEMAVEKQLIVITHLPQIAAVGKEHFHVSKEEINNKTRSFVNKINKEQRILEIARMISGENGVSETTLLAAKEMMT
jgi:DNA repair protein RecN (Recombination protein N)